MPDINSPQPIGKLKRKNNFMIGNILINDVRVGNIVKPVKPLLAERPALGIERGPYCEITAAGINRIAISGSWCDPVPLNDKWMDIFGYIPLGAPNFIQTNYKNGLSWEVAIGTIQNYAFHENYRDILTGLRYVHELQNFHYAMEKKDLPIDLQKITKYFGGPNEQTN